MCAARRWSSPAGGARGTRAAIFGRRLAAGSSASAAVKRGRVGRLFRPPRLTCGPSFRRPRDTAAPDGSCPL